MTPGLALIGMIVETADQLKLDSIAVLTSRLVGLPKDALQGDEARLMRAVRAALDTGQPPTVAALHAIDPTLGGALVASAVRAVDAEGSFGSIQSAVKAITDQHHTLKLAQTVQAAYAALQAGRLDDATALLSAVDYGVMRGGHERLHDFLDHDINAAAPDRPFKFRHKALNKALGGGLGSGSTHGLSLWVGPSGMGKSSFWWDEGVHQCEQGHWFVLLAAESDAPYTFDQMVRLRAGLTEEAYTPQQRAKVPQFQQRALQARGEITELVRRGQLQVWTDAFDPAKLREIAEMKLAQMRDAGATGKLIIVVDNYDALFENMGDAAGPQAVNQEMQRLQRHTRDRDYHIALLAQGSTESETMMGPCGASDVYGNRKLHMKVAHMVTMYRPKSREARELRDKVTDEPHVGSRAWLAVRKKRGPGEEGAMIEMESSNPIGAWRELRALPF